MFENSKYFRKLRYHREKVRVHIIVYKEPTDWGYIKQIKFVYYS